jgi:hypothetical protein
MGQMCSEDNTVGGPPFVVGQSGTNPQQYHYPNQQQLPYQTQQYQNRQQMMPGQPIQPAKAIQAAQTIPTIQQTVQTAPTIPQVPVAPTVAFASNVPTAPQNVPQPVLEQKTEVTTISQERDLIRESLQDSIYFGLKTPSLVTNQNSHITAGNSGFHFAQQSALGKKP